MTQIIIALLIVRFFIWIIPDAEKFVQHLLRQMTNKIRGKKNASIFENNYIEVKAFYVREFNATPCISFINNLDVEKAYGYVNNGFAGKVLATYQRNYYSWHRARLEFGTQFLNCKTR